MTLPEAIAQLRQCNQKVPLPLRLPTPQEIQETEHRLGLSFHPDFVYYLQHGSDCVFGTMEPVTITRPNSHTYLETVANDAWNYAEVPKDLLPICADNGDYFCMDSSGRIVFWAHDGASKESWPDLAAWITEVWIGGR
jgi:hypothetical protein